MKVSKYLKDKKLSIILFVACFFIMLGMFLAFRIPKQLIAATAMICFFMGICLILIDLCRKKKFYDGLVENTGALDQKFLVLETLEKPNFYEGEILYENMYEINKSMVERIGDYRENIDDFKEYIEMWIHEVKIPISSLVLMCHNDKKDNESISREQTFSMNHINEKYIKQIRRLDNYTDQVLYYMRSNCTENDYLIKETALDKIVANVLIKNKDDLLENKMNISVDVRACKVMIDAKWIEFILNQIINNSIKYKRSDIDSVIKIQAKEDAGSVYLSIYDNGIGIPSKDVASVFKKSFTGENGRKGAKSTGMGLYIAKKLCVKLGHKIEISSKENQWTQVTIIFGKNDYYTFEK